MYAIVEVKGKQYKIEKGQDILIEYLGDDAKESPEIKTLLSKKR
ncbi:50S ribosomal protein L21 [Brachyspira pilosicoli P43/6/78]|uniref:50S ribosomal protein L21 n=1 Tax=Brachyspira pilosicoli P43/6/78 TaxID=1042417 RepID=A0A3B6VL94_BRAPL|nr:bL21 family ribosomal protein [Brachyspira pilosicoli]AGA66681.1 50S ribosomal protein L21 [Brachyspira pilosicoli P43/6/78]